MNRKFSWSERVKNPRWWAVIPLVLFLVLVVIPFALALGIAGAITDLLNIALKWLTNWLSGKADQLKNLSKWVYKGY